jgi:hypothetical protein
MIRHVEAKAATQPDHVAALVTLLRLVIPSDADPYLLTGALIEGIAATLDARIPVERRGEVAVATVQLLRDRLRVYRAI